MAKRSEATAAKQTASRMGIGTDPEPLDRTPIAIPLSCKTPTPLHELIARMVREHVQAETGDEPETWEEANDFDIDAEAELLDFSPYTLVDETPESPLEAPEAPAATPVAPSPQTPVTDDSEASDG